MDRNEANSRYREETLGLAIEDKLRIAGARARLALAQYKHDLYHTPYLDYRRPDYDAFAAAVEAELAEWERILLQTEEPVEDVRDLEARLRDAWQGVAQERGPVVAR